MNDFKIVFSGTTGAGKTTAIAAISEIPPVKTDVLNTDDTLDKTYTTVGLDYGELTLPNNERLRLFGTPGQERFEFMWRIVVRDALGLVILVDNSRASPLEDLSLYVHAFRSALDSVPCVIGVGRTEHHTHPSIDDFADHLASFNLSLPIIPVDVRKKDDVNTLLHILLAQIESDVHAS